MNHVYDVAEWIVYNIEDLGTNYVESESSLSFTSYIQSRAATALQNKYTPRELQEIFEDERIKKIIEFYEEAPDESEDTLH